MGFDAYRSPQATPLCGQGDYLQRFVETESYNECEAKELAFLEQHSPEYACKRAYSIQEYEPGAMTYVKGRVIK